MVLGKCYKATVLKSNATFRLFVYWNVEKNCLIKYIFIFILFIFVIWFIKTTGQTTEQILHLSLPLSFKIKNGIYPDNLQLY